MSVTPTVIAIEDPSQRVFLHFKLYRLVVMLLSPSPRLLPCLRHIPRPLTSLAPGPLAASFSTSCPLERRIGKRVRTIPQRMKENMAKVASRY